MRNWKLGPDGRTPVPVDDIIEWGRWFEHSDAERQVGYDQRDGVTVSTVFLGTDYNFAGVGPPILFETMVWNDNDGSERTHDRYMTWEEAEAGHREALALAHTYNDLKIREAP